MLELLAKVLCEVGATIALWGDKMHEKGTEIFDKIDDDSGFSDRLENDPTFDPYPCDDEQDEEILPYKDYKWITPEQQASMANGDNDVQTR